MSYHRSVRTLREKSARGAWIVGHRGAKALAPENTMVSFELAWRLGADMVECDVHLSKDGKCVVFHDQQLERTTNGTGLIRETQSAKLKKLDAGAWFSPVFSGQKIPLLKELLLWARKKLTSQKLPLVVMIEIKSESVNPITIAHKVYEDVAATQMLEQVVLISFDERILRELRLMHPAFLTGVIHSRPVVDPIALCRRAKARVLLPGSTAVTESYIRQAHAQKFTVVPWAIDDRKEVLRLLRYGVDAISTNRPDTVAQILDARKEEPFWKKVPYHSKLLRRQP